MPLRPGDVQDRVHLGRRAPHVDRDDGLGPPRDRLLDGAGSRQSVSSTSTMTGMALAGSHGGGRGEERVGRHDHLVARADAERPVRGHQGRGAGIDGQAVPRPDQLAHRPFRRLHLAGPGIVVAEQVRSANVGGVRDHGFDASLHRVRPNSHMSTISRSSSLPIFVGNGPSLGDRLGAAGNCEFFRAHRSSLVSPTLEHANLSVHACDL